MKNLLITMSGGTTSVINATLAGLIEAAQKSKKINKIYAGLPGILGFMNEKFIDLTNVSKQELFILKNSPGSASIGTTRIKILDKNEYKKISDIFIKHNIGYFVNIGGNGTIKQTKSIASAINTIQVAAAPKTVDNDLGDKQFSELWHTPGFSSCVNYWRHKMQMLNNENIGAHSHDKVLIAQTFGRETGHIVGSLRYFDPERKTPLILLIPEDQQSSDKVLAKIDNTLQKFDRAIIGICEGYYIDKCDYQYDFSGQKMYGSSKSSAMQQLINLCMQNNIQARGYNPTIDQRQNFNYTLKEDLKISYDIGVKIIENFMNGKSHFFQSYSKNGLNDIPLDEIKDYTRTLKREWIAHNDFDVSDKYIEYLKEFVPLTKNKQLFTLGSVI